MRPSDAFQDDRGIIEDLLTTPIDAVTRITTLEGAVRGNHVHRETTQWTYVVSGCLEVVTDRTRTFLSPGETCVHWPGEPHAWRAVTDAEVFVFTRGPRSGKDYESDVERLAEPLILPLDRPDRREESSA